ncbi:MAG: hypothetical protein ACKOA8_01555 [Deltaproteobacteria bacterium]
MKLSFKNLLFLLLISATCCTATFAGSAGLRLANFKIGFLRTSPKNFDSSTSPEIGWTPIVDLGLLAVRGEISLFSAKHSDKTKFIISNYEAYLMLPLFTSIIVAEAGGGVQNWSGQGGISPVVSGSLMLRIGETIDRLYLTYSRVFVSNNASSVFKVGLGINL